MAAVTYTVSIDMGDAMICQLVDDSFTSLFANSTATGQTLLAGSGLDTFRTIFNANMALLETAEVGLSAQTDLEGGQSWQTMVPLINAQLTAAKTAVNA